MKVPFFTVLIDTYNYREFIEEAVASALGQDFPTEEREILVVDDGSTDDTQERLQKFGKAIPSVTHVDGRARPQTVEKEINPLYWRLINEFGKRTGVPVVMNTSFNLRGEAIVHTPTDASRTFFSSGMDALVIGSFLVEK
jgi:predicted NodU family carbamoyl transferase